MSKTTRINMDVIRAHPFLRTYQKGKIVLTCGCGQPLGRPTAFEETINARIKEHLEAVSHD